MLVEIIKQFNWVDILFIIIMIRICYVSVKRGLVVEFFKFFGTLVAIYVSLHYYTGLSDFWQNRVNLEFIPLAFVDFLCVVVLAVLIYLVFVLLREVFGRFIKVEAVPHLNKWGGLVLGVFRGFLLISLFSFILVISTIDYFKLSVSRSYSGERLFKVAPRIYSSIWNGFMSKFATQEKFNKTVTEVEEKFK